MSKSYNSILNSNLSTDQSISNGTYTTATAASNLVIGNSNIAVGYGNSAFYNTADCFLIDDFETIIVSLDDEEIESFLDKIIERQTNNKDALNSLLNHIIRIRHFSEDFILKYFEYFQSINIMLHHKADILTQRYPRLALLIEGLKS